MFSRQALPIDINLSTDMSKYESFISRYHKWIHSSEQTVKGLPGSNPFIVSGITDAFNQLYGLYNKIGIFKGEYGYHNLVLSDRVTFNLQEADCIVISHPFSADGNDSSALIRYADKLNIPIFIDCAFFGICSGISFDFSEFKNIHSVCFSLSKTFGTGLHRVGLLYTKDKFPTAVYRKWNYPLITQALQHYDMLEERSPDWACTRYRNKQTAICKLYNFLPSSTVIFAIDYSDKYIKYKRGNSNRICISARLNDKAKDMLHDMDRMGQTN